MSRHIAELKALIVATSAYYGQTLGDQVVQMYAEDLADLPLEQVKAALQHIRRDPKQSRFPLPAIIRDRIRPAETADSDAREAAARIVAAVSKFGWTNPELARDFVGDLGWRVVQMQGGWLTVCETLTTDNVGQLQAQWRELALSTYRRAVAGTLPEAPAIPQAIGHSQGGGLERLGFPRLEKKA